LSNLIAGAALLHVWTDGESEVDESPVTGESDPVPKAEGASMFAGSVNASGALQVRVSKPSSDNTIARIIKLAGMPRAASIARS
jgi:cation transport ATPase